MFFFSHPIERRPSPSKKKKKSGNKTKQFKIFFPYFMRHKKKKTINVRYTYEFYLWIDQSICESIRYKRIYCLKIW